MPESLSIAEWQARYGQSAEPESLSLAEWQARYAPKPSPTAFGLLQKGQVGDALGLMGRNAGQSILGAGKEAANQFVRLAGMTPWGMLSRAFGPPGSDVMYQPYFGLENEEQRVGADALKFLEFLSPGGPLKGAAGAVVQGAKAGGIAATQGESPTIPALFGAAGPVAGAVGSRAAPALGKLARTQYGKALDATTGPLKAEAERIIPELLERGVTGSLPKLARQGQAGRREFGAKIGQAIEDATQAGRTVNVQPIVTALDDLKAPFMATNAAGQAFPANPGAVQAIEGIQELVQKFGTSAPPDQLHKVLRSLDDIVGKSNGFTRELPRGTAADITRKAREAFRAELNRAVPNLDALNAEFALWKGLDRVANATIRRKQGQQRTVEYIFQAGVGAGAGFLGGGDLQDAGILAGLAFLSRTPKWRTFSAAQKNQLAHYLATNRMREAAALVGRLGAGAAASSPPNQ